MTDPKKIEISIDELREVFRYCEITGNLYWKKRISSRTKIGYPAGCLHLGYIVIRYKNRIYKAHRLAWTIYYGDNPPTFIDHINRDKTDNRIENLRLASRKQNRANSNLAANNTLGFTGVHKASTKGKWIAVTMMNKKSKYLGTYATKEEAAKAYSDEMKKSYGEFSSV